jgi:glycine oxidase
MNKIGPKPGTTLIIGGGVIGLSLAWELSRRFQPVWVIESDPSQHPPSSWAGAGMLPPAAAFGAVDPFEQLKALSQRLHPEWARQLHMDTGIDTGFRPSGGIYLASSPAEAATLLANQYWWDQHGIEHRKLDLHQLLQLEPSLESYARGKMQGAWLLPGEHQIRNPRFLQALRSANQRLGVQFSTDTVVRLDVSEEAVVSVRTESGQTFSADQICVCSGAWTRILLEQLQIKTGIMPIRGQILLYQCSRPLLSHIVLEGNRYLVPRDDGRLLVGSVEEEVGYVCETTQAAIDMLTTWAEQILPEVKHAAIVEKSWAGLRPGSYDGMPYLGAVPGFKNLYVASGHFRSGLQLSCGTAVVMADLILGQPSEIDLTPFRVGRG